MSEISEKIAAERFTVPAKTMADVVADDVAVATLGLQAHDSPASGVGLWTQWTDAARNADVKLPYSTWLERFRGGFPSFLPEEEKILEHMLLGKPQEPRPAGAVPIMLTTIGAPGSGKSTLLKEIAAIEVPGAVRVDPDEGVLENFGPYLWARHMLRTAIGESADTDDATRIKANNRWRLPPYEVFRWTSNAINTMIAQKAVAAQRDVEFHWTGAGAFGLSLIKDGYKAAGYKTDALVVVTGREERLKREAKRQRPAAPEDFETKAVDFIKLLPQSLPQMDRIRIYDGDATPSLQVFEAVRENGADAYTIISCDEEGLRRAYATMQQDIATAQLADKAPYQTGLDFLSRLTGVPLPAEPVQSPAESLKAAPK